jgi:hypothetical protein
MAIVDMANAQLQQAAGAGQHDLNEAAGDTNTTGSMSCKRSEQLESSYDYGALALMKGVRHLSDSGITRLPDRYVLPASDRPGATVLAASSTAAEGAAGVGGGGGSRVKLPVVDLAGLRDPSQRAAVLATLDAACREYGFFQVRRTYVQYTSPVVTRAAPRCSCMRARVTSAAGYRRY